MLDKDIKKNIEKIKNDYNNSCDLSFKDINILKRRVSLVYLSSICDNNLIDNFLLKNINKLSKNGLTIYIIRIDEGVNPPYITNSGIIFERISSSSNPVSDSATINRILEKRKDNIKKIENRK